MPVIREHIKYIFVIMRRFLDHADFDANIGYFTATTTIQFKQFLKYVRMLNDF